MDVNGLLQDQSAALVASARRIIHRVPVARVAGVIILPECAALPSLRAALYGPSRHTLVCHATVGILPRQHIEQFLRTGATEEYWMEQGWQRQTILPVALFAASIPIMGFFPLYGESLPSPEL